MRVVKANQKAIETHQYSYQARDINDSRDHGAASTGRTGTSQSGPSRGGGGYKGGITDSGGEIPINSACAILGQDAC